MTTKPEFRPDQPLDELVESPLNPRKVFVQEHVDELAEDLEKHGMLQPIVARPMNGHLEVVVGAKRRRAALQKNWTTVPVIVREMNDQEVLEAQIVENAKRSDIHPLEQADSYQMLMTKFGLTAEQIAEKVGKSESWVYQQLQLCKLSKSAREALEAGKISASIAVEIARIPVPKLQDQAAKHIAGGGGRRHGFTNEAGKWETAPMSFREAAAYIRTTFHLRLADAPWKIDDAELLPKVGACSECPKRSGNQPALFADIASADVCTDPPCFALKKKAAGKQRLAEAKKSGQRVLSRKEASEVVEETRRGSRWIRHNSGFIDPDSQCYDDPKYRDHRKALGKDAPTPVLAPLKDGSVMELYDAKEVKKALKAKGIKGTSTSTPARREKRKPTPLERKRDFYDALRERVRPLVREAVDRQRMLAMPAKTVPFWRMLVGALSENFEACETVVRERGLKPKASKTSKYVDPTALVKDEANRLKGNELLGLVVDLATDRDLDYRPRREQPDLGVLGTACELFGVDVKGPKAELAKACKAIATQERKASRKKAAAKKKGARKKGAKKTARKKKGARKK